MKTELKYYFNLRANYSKNTLVSLRTWRKSTEVLSISFIPKTRYTRAVASLGGGFLGIH